MLFSGSVLKWIRGLPGVARAGVFLAWVVVGWQVPGWLKPVPFVLALVALVWAVPALGRDVDWLTGRALRAVKWLEVRLRRLRASRWALLAGLLSVAALGLGVVKALPTWGFHATSSLREDETLNIEQYTSRNFARSVSSYDRARNHVLYNVINSLVPGGASTWTPRARGLSILATAGGIALLAAYAAWRGWWGTGALVAAWLAMNQLALRSLLEARGYGLLFFFSMLTCVAVMEWLRTGRTPWLWTLSVLAILGTYTLPFYLLFGGGVLVALFAHSPRREIFHAGLMAGVVIFLLYVPLMADLAKVAGGYAREYATSSTNNFSSLAALQEVLQYAVPYGFKALDDAAVVIFGFGVVLAVLARGWLARWLRDGVAVVFCAVLLSVAFFLTVGSVPMRSAAFLGGPCGFLLAAVTGGLLVSPRLGALRGPLGVLAAAAALGIVAATAVDEPLVPRQDWRTIGRVIGRVAPDAAIWTEENYAEVLQWNRPGRPQTAGGKLSPARFLRGGFAAVDAQIHNWALNRRPTWADFPEGIRFVTFPLLLNYQRLFFLPPQDSGIESVTWKGGTIPARLAGSQVPDGSLLERSGGTHAGEPLRASPAPAPPALPGLWAGPGQLVVTLSEPVAGRYCQFLFSPHLPAGTVKAEWGDISGHWHPAGDLLHVGEYLGIAIPPSARAVRLLIGPTGRDVGLLDAWVGP